SNEGDDEPRTTVSSPADKDHHRAGGAGTVGPGGGRAGAARRPTACRKRFRGNMLRTRWIRGGRMSHFTKVRTRLSDGEVLRKALAEMGYDVEPAGKGVRGYRGRRTDAEFKVRPGRGGYEIGFAPSDDGYVLVADWFGIRGTTEQSFLRELRQR